MAAKTRRFEVCTWCFSLIYLHVLNMMYDTLHMEWCSHVYGVISGCLAAILLMSNIHDYVTWGTWFQSTVYMCTYTQMWIWFWIKSLTMMCLVWVGDGRDIWCTKCAICAVDGAPKWMPRCRHFWSTLMYMDVYTIWTLVNYASS